MRTNTRACSFLQRAVSCAGFALAIAANAADEFRKIFTEELQDKGDYQVVDTAAPEVLVLRPAIINLAITAPDLQSPDMNRTIAQSAKPCHQQGGGRSHAPPVGIGPASAPRCGARQDVRKVK
ncbi:MAG: DUF3313 domain-containing protein [Gammaproteobacteria bacterium]|nr:DUF3313 domain-containing protein [Gammaproteobacteria bacterium]